MNIGEEYANMLNNLDLYCQTYDLAKLAAKTHPPSIYTEPQSRIKSNKYFSNLIRWNDLFC